MNLSDFYPIAVVLLVVCGVVAVFIRIAIRIRKGGGSMTTLMLGATDEFLIKDRQKASEMIVEQNAGKKLDEQCSGDTGNHESCPPLKEREST
jgi:hypothetical protein